MTLSWLKSCVPDLNVSAREFADTMTMAGIKVTGYEQIDRNLEKIVVGQILSCERHPDAENLTVCQVDTGRETIPCITSASNLSVGDKVPVALEGGKVDMLHDEPEPPGDGGVRVHCQLIRGRESRGILCTVEELGFTREAVTAPPEYAVYVFDEDAEVGADAVELLGLSDVLFTFRPVSARKDCFHVLGMAREVAAIFGKKFVTPEIRVETNGEDVSDYLSLRVEDGILCPRCCARVVKDVKLGPSPRWMQRRLISCGIRPVNRLVDITNYVMEEYGQPVLAFDLDRLAGHTLVFKRAEDGETFRTLDGQLREVDSQTLMICDGEGPIGIAGIMGGDSAKVSGSGRSIALVSSCFDSAYIRRLSKKLNLTTEISRRFSVGLDANYAEEGLERACQLFEELDGGIVTGGMIDECFTVVGSRQIEFRPDWINHCLGTQIPEEEMEAYLQRLGFERDAETGDMIPPLGRPDVETEAELAGEIARLYGYDRIPMTIPRVETTRGTVPKKMQIESMARNLAEFYGYSQIMTYSFDDPAVFDRLRLPADSPWRRAVPIENPLSEETSIMRTTSAGKMLSTLALNSARKHRQVRLYELANIYIPRDLARSELPEERMQFTLGTYGNDDFFTVKGLLEEFLRRCGLMKTVVCDPSPERPFLHPGRQATLLYDGCVIGYLGEVHPLVQTGYGIQDRAILAVLDMPEIVERADFTRRFAGLNRYARVSRDLSLVMPEEMPASAAEETLLAAAGPCLEKRELTDIYRGEPIPAGCKSLTYRLRFQAEDHNITGGEVQEILSGMVRALKKKGICLRS